MKPWMKAFFAGALFEVALRSLSQDFHGKEAYLRMVDAGWVSGWITVPIALAVLALSCKLLYDAIKGGPSELQVFINGAKVENFEKELNITVDNSLRGLHD